MQDVLPWLALLACPVAMGLMMWMMMGRSHGSEQAESSTPVAQELAQLRSEVRALQAERAHARDD